MVIHSAANSDPILDCARLPSRAMTHPANPPDLITTREAIDFLQPLGIGRESTRKALHGGLAGPPVVTSWAHLWDRDRLRALPNRPRVEVDDLAPELDRGIFVARMGNTAIAPAGPWSTSLWLRILWELTIKEQGFVPLVVTLGGFVVDGANIIAVHESERLAGQRGEAGHFGQRTTFTLDAPGAWFAAFREHRLSTGSGTNWHWWEPRRGAPRASA